MGAIAIHLDYWELLTAGGGRSPTDIYALLGDRFARKAAIFHRNRKSCLFF